MSSRSAPTRTQTTPAPAQPPRAAERIRASARELFYREGIRAVGVDEIVSRAGVTKPSLYRSFPSKDELAASYLRQYDLEFWDRFDEAVNAHPGDPRAQIKAFLTRVGKRTQMPQYRGCGMTNAAVEYPEHGHPARVVNLLISDVPGDNPMDIASGPTVADSTTCADALEVVRRYGIDLPAGARRLLESGAGETVKPGNRRLEHVETHIVASPQMALEAAADVARKAGVTPLILGDSIEGEARDVAKVMAGIALQARRHGQPIAGPCVLLSGGETTVTIRGNGRGGRNVEFLLALAVALDGAPDIHALAGDTDGVDGAEEIAGAFVTPDTLARGWERGMPPRASLENNDAHTFFRALGDSLITGPTLTNVNDFRAIYVA